ncbi:MAG: hypothetical protein QOD53_2397 [Thermoleophilaceae bacterium]|nr:hypothetical protein [Thermoleophilaceae bacterium]
MLSVLTLLLVVPSARATTVVTPDGATAQPYQRWVDRAKVPTPPGTFMLGRGDCPYEGYPSGISCSYLAERTIFLSEAGRNRWTLLHELGHEFDYWVAPAWMRDAFLNVIGYPRGGPWAGPPGAPVWETTPRELFAEGYSACAMRRTIRRRWDGNYGYSPTPRQHRLVCKLLRRA